MELSSVVAILNELLASHQPEVFNSSWIRKHAPQCYRFMQRNLRREFGGIDWDRLTGTLDRQFQRRWRPAEYKRNAPAYENDSELATITGKYRDKLYVFVTASDEQDRRTRDAIGISLVRLAQKGNRLALRKLVELIRDTIDAWIDWNISLSRWRGHEDEIQIQIEACVRRYRYTGSFATYLFRTLECAGRGIRPVLLLSIENDSVQGRAP